MCRADRKNHVIRPGETMLVVKDGLGEKSYCLACARTILQRGRQKLEALFRELERSVNSSPDDFRTDIPSDSEKA